MSEEKEFYSAAITHPYIVMVDADYVRDVQIANKNVATGTEAEDESDWNDIHDRRLVLGVYEAFHINHAIKQAIESYPNYDLTSSMLSAIALAPEGSHLHIAIMQDVDVIVNDNDKEDYSNEDRKLIEENQRDISEYICDDFSIYEEVRNRLDNWLKETKYAIASEQE